MALGEAEAGVAYVTNVTPSISESGETVDIPDEYNATANNYAAVPNKASNPQLAQDFLDFMVSSDGQKIVQGFGYEPIQ